jgi:hypothetical protein
MAGCRDDLAPRRRKTFVDETSDRGAIEAMGER